MLLRTDTVRALHADTRGLSVVEYAILAVLIAVIGLIAWSLFGEEVEQKVVLATEQMGGVGQEGSRIPSAGGAGGGAGGNAGGAGAPGTAAGGGAAGSDQELAAAHGSSGGGGSSTPSVAGSDTHAAGVVSRSNGGGSVYVAPGADEDDSGVWFTLLGIIVFFLLGIVVFAKMKGRAAR